jgi:hypothetical protein
MNHIKKKILRLLNSLFSFFFIRIYESRNKQLIEKLINTLKVHDLGYQLIRIGSDNDGGYLVPNILNQIRYCFSPGVGGSSSFERDLQNRNIKCFLADNSVDLKSDIVKSFDFEKKNISSLNSKNTITLEDWVNLKIDKSSNDLLLQMDIEGDEYEVILSANEDFIKRFKVMIIEFHYLDHIANKLGYKYIGAVFKKLLNYFDICHIHPNNADEINIICGFNIPSVLEITLLRKDLILKKEKLNYILHPLDQDNKLNNKKIILSKKFY